MNDHPDDGGVRGLSELIILREIMHRLKHLENLKSLPKPCEYFDIIGGSGTGGVIALMLGRLRMPIELAIENYVLFSREVFSNVKKWSRGEKLKATVLESGIRGIVQSTGFLEDIMMQEDDPLCKSFVVALPSANLTPRIFRTYQVEANQGYDCTVVQAACATTAVPNLFKPVSITSGGISETFVGASFGYSNPTKFVLEEAGLAFGLSQPVACLVSIGAGSFDPISWEPDNAFGQRMVQLLHKIATDCEASAENFAKSYMQISGFFYRFSVQQGLQKIAVDDWNKDGDIKSHSFAYLQNIKVGQELESLINTLHTCPQRTTFEVLRGGNLSTNLSIKQTPSELAQVLLPIVPSPSPLFIGRENILSHLENYFVLHQSDMQQRYVLYGLHGAGKTQIALQFCYKFKSSSKASIEQSLMLLARNAQLGDKTPSAALTWFCHQKKEWLMIFDNADDPDMDLNEFFPACSHGNILITSRNEASKIYAPENHDKIREMSSEDSLAVFYKASQRLKTEETAAKELVKELGYLALAIVQAGSYLLLNQHIEIKQYLESFRIDRKKCMEEVGTQKIDDYQLSVFATWNLSYQKLDDKAKAILMLCSVLHNSKIPVSILEEAWKKIPASALHNNKKFGSIFKKAWKTIFTTYTVDTSELYDFLKRFVVQDKKWSDNLVEKAVNMLRSYSLVETRGKGMMLLEIHSLVHSWAFDLLSRKEQNNAKKCAQQLFYCLADEDLEYNEAAQLALHIRALINCLNHNYDDIKVAEKLANIFLTAHLWSDAEQIFQQIVEHYKRNFGNHHSKTIVAIYLLIETYIRSGKLEEAEKIEQEVLRVKKKELGSNHPQTLSAMSELARIHKFSGHIEEAEKLQQEVLKIRTRNFGSRHPDTLLDMIDLATIFYASGRFEEAEKLQKQVLMLKIKQFGSSHPDTILPMVYLSGTYQSWGKFEEAEKLQQEIVRIRKEKFGSSHPDTIFAISSLSETLSKSGKLDEAEKLQHEVLEARSKLFGSNHPDTLNAIMNLAATFYRSGKFEEAEKLQQKVLIVRTEKFGSGHPDTIHAMFHLATTFYTGGKLEEAEKLFKEVVVVRTEKFGRKHPDTIHAMINLAAIFSEGRKLEEAQKLQQEVLILMTEIIGRSHPETILTMFDLATTFYESGKFEEAEKLQQEVLIIRTEKLGSSHPDTILAMSSLSKTFAKNGKLEEAEELQHEILRVRTKSFKSSHPNTFDASGRNN
ncbi:hypothetical protein C0993_007003 [Termitomyces sp. T159_Od127]|nr:hypothetical protein C0993_007003 [Termitomyces sp. T159_Od127]